MRRAAVNHIEETSWQQAGALKWVWTMTNCLVAFFIVHSNRSRKAFEVLVENWRGILVNDNYAVYRNWVNHRQVCLARYCLSCEAECCVWPIETSLNSNSVAWRRVQGLICCGG